MAAHVITATSRTILDIFVEHMDDADLERPLSGDTAEDWPRPRDGRHGSQPSRYADRASGPKRA
jgi:hypothetical protein